MAFTNEDVQEIKEIVLETIAEESDPIEDVQQVSELSDGDEVPIVRSSQGVNSYGRAPVNLFGGGGGGGEPAQYLKKAAVSQDGNTLTLTNKNNSTVTFTPNTGGGYNPPQGGIPKSDLSSSVQASLDNADTALQSHQDISGKADKSDTYTKNEVDAAIDAVETNVSANASEIENLKDMYQQAISGSDIVIGTLPSTGVKNKIYRVPGTTSYSDYMWNGTTFVLMATYSNSIDEHPTDGSNNIVKSGGVFESMQISEQSLVLPDFLRSAFCRLGTPLTFTSAKYIKTDLTTGDTVNLTPQSASASTRYCLVNCTEDDLFFISNCTGGGGARLYCFVDSNSKVIDVSKSFNTSFTGFIKAPLRTTKAIFHIIQPTGAVYPVNVNRYINIKDFPVYPDYSVSEPLPCYVDSDGYHVGKFVLFKNNEGMLVTPQNSGSTLSLSTIQDNNGFIVYNFSTQNVRIETSSSGIAYNDYVLDFFSGKEFFGGNASNKYYSHIVNTNSYKFGHIFDSYMAGDAVFTNNSVTLSFCRGAIGGQLVLHEILVGGVVTKQEFVFESNGYLVYNTQTNSARIVNSYTNIGQNDYIWLYYSGAFVGGLLYPNYIQSICKSNSSSTDNTVLKRAQQLLNIRWNAKGTIADTESTDGISAGEHVGVPYTSCMEVDKFVGWDVSIKTFMTAVNNPYSLIYTEDLKRNISGYGFTYHGSRATIGGYMGIVCNIFALYSTCYPIPFDTGNWDYLRRIGEFIEIGEQDFMYAEIGDLIWEPGHGNVVVDVEKNANGYATSIKWAESTADFPRLNNYTTQEANNRLNTSGGKIYRLRERNKYMFYERSPFVATQGEGLQGNYVYNNDICTFAGDYAAFREGQIIFLNYNLTSVGNWQYIELYKDGSLFGTYSIDNSSHRYELTNLNLEKGKYKARMKYGDTYSGYTYFQIIETDVSVSYASNRMKVDFSSSNGHPLYVRLCKADGGPVCIIPLSDEDIRNGSIEFDPQYYIGKQGYSVVHNGTYLKVSFSGEYGCVTNEPILTQL